MAAKKTLKTRAGTLKMYEKSILLSNHTLFLAQPVDVDQLKVVRDMLNRAYRLGQKDQQRLMRMALGLEG